MWLAGHAHLLKPPPARLGQPAAPAARRPAAPSCGRSPHHRSFIMLPSADSAGVFSRLSMCWVAPVVMSSRRGELTAETLPPVLPRLQSQVVTQRISGLWGGQSAGDGNRPPSLPRAYAGLLKSPAAWGVLNGAIQGVASTVMRPLLLRLMIDVLNRPRDLPVHTGEAVAVVSAFAAVNLLESYSRTHAAQAIQCECGSLFVSATSGLILQKALTVRLAAAATARGPAGKPTAPTSAGTGSSGGSNPLTAAEISNLLGNDVLQTQVAFMYMAFLTWGVVGFICAAIVLTWTVGPAAAAAGIAVNVGLVVASILMSNQLKRVQRSNLHAADKRMKVLVSRA